MATSGNFTVIASAGYDYPNNSQNQGVYYSDYIVTPNSNPFKTKDIQIFAQKMGIYLNIPNNTGNYPIQQGWQGIVIKSNEEIIYQETVDFDRDNQKWVYKLILNGTTTTQIYNEDQESLIPYFTEREINVPTSNIYTVEYRFQYRYAGNSWVFTATAPIAIVYNRLPLKKWTITDVIVRACDLIEPLRYGQKPRFRLDGVIYDDTTGNATGYQSGSIAEELDKIIAPEYAFTKMTFREQMQQVGGYIHGEFRITGFNLENGKRYYTFNFDKYGGNRRAVIKDLKRPVSATFKTDINEYCTALDSSAENVINQLDWAQGVIVEPFNDSTISLRCEQTTARMGEDDNLFIPSTDPLYEAGKTFEIDVDFRSRFWEITPYIFEKAVYDSELSSYDGTYPYCKAYALYYTQGERHIKGLFFKVENAVSPIFREYAIVNILRAVTGDNSIDLTPQEIMELGFRIKYKPIYSERIITNKQCVIGGIPRTLAYNQTANLIEARHYGEHLKGIVARLGNVERTLTYYLAFLGDIPKVGTLFDDNYYISAVYCERLEPYIKCTIALSKDFNRLSQYIGINSEKRMWEVSEKMAQKRESVIREYFMFSEKDISGNTALLSGNFTLQTLFNKGYAIDDFSPISAAKVRRYNKNRTVANNNDITLPVVSAAAGNSMLFTFKFADNYSAGQKTIYKAAGTAQNDISGRWANFVPYCDYYGRFWWLGFDLIGGSVFPRYSTDKENIPNVNPITYSGYNMFSIDYAKYRKDSREVPQITCELSAVADSEDFIIGSGLMRNCKAVNRSPKNYQLYLFKNRINKIDSRIPFETLIAGVDYVLLDIGNVQFNVNDIDFSNVVIPDFAYSAWGIVTEKTTEQIQVEDDDGNEFTQEIIDGGELCIGQNKTLPLKINGARIDPKQIES